MHYQVNILFEKLLIVGFLMPIIVPLKPTSQFILSAAVIGNGMG